MSSSLDVWTARFTPDVDHGERDTALRLLDELHHRKDDYVPPKKYVRQLTVAMPSFPGLGLDMKDYIFARDLDERVYDADGFTMRSGLLTEDPYSGEPLPFRQSELRDGWVVHIDHVVAVADAWVSGGYRWMLKGRQWKRLCNDPTNLLAVSSRANTSKGDRNAALWLPDNPVHDWRARYVILQIQVKHRYVLSVTDSEATVMSEILNIR